MQENSDEINLREYLEVILKHWPVIAGITLLIASSALIFSLIKAPTFEAKTTLLLKGQNSSLSQYGGLANMLGVNLNIGPGGNADDLIELLSSRVVAAKVFDDLNLSKRMAGWDMPSVKRQKLIIMTSQMIKKPTATGKVLEIIAVSGDPQLSADLANGFVSALIACWNELNFSQAQSKLKYINEELPRVAADLQSIEAKLRLAPQSVSGFTPSGQGSSQRDFDIYNSVYTMLKKERETAKLEAAKEIPPFSVIDKAEVPLTKSTPKTKLNVLIGVVIGLFLGVFIAFFQEYWEKSSKD